mmetsp:Transcript_60305/g.178642  ORF Transcript_60305/g.178642 Transcript_60305/m.178642 type:complete len:334 (-) Transcript_60305:320-1321(-)
MIVAAVAIRHARPRHFAPPKSAANALNATFRAALIGRLDQRRSKSSVLRKPAADADETRLKNLLHRLRNVDTAALCDADKALLATHTDGYIGLGLMGTSMRPRNYHPYALKESSSGGHESTGDGRTAHHPAELGRRMVGLARTVQCSRPNDFFAVIRGLDGCKAGDILVVNTLDSTRALAGGLFLSEASRRRMGGVIIDGPVRDVAQLAEVRELLVYSTSVTPYSGTVQSVGDCDIPVTCGGVRICPGDVIVGDGDGVVAGSRETFEALIEPAENIVDVEKKILRGIREGHSLHSMMNYKEHLEARIRGEESAITFKKTRLNSLKGVKSLNYE